MTCHFLMQFASPAGEGQETAHSVPADGRFFFLSQKKKDPHFIFLPSFSLSFWASLHRTACFLKYNMQHVKWLTEIKNG